MAPGGAILFDMNLDEFFDSFSYEGMYLYDVVSSMTYSD